MQLEDSQQFQLSNDKNDIGAILLNNQRLEDEVQELRLKLDHTREQLEEQQKYYQNDNDILYLQRDQLNIEKDQYKNDYLSLKAEQMVLQKQLSDMANPENNKALADLKQEMAATQRRLQEQTHKNRQLEEKIRSINDQREQDLQLLRETLQTKEEQDQIIEEQVKKIREQNAKMQTMQQQINRQRTKIESFKEDKYDEQDDSSQNYLDILNRMQQQQQQQLKMETPVKIKEQQQQDIVFPQEIQQISDIKPSSNSTRKPFMETDQLQLVTPPPPKMPGRMVFKNLNIETNYEQGDSEHTHLESVSEEVKPLKSNRKNNKSIKFSFNVQEPNVIKDEVIECTTVKKKPSYQEQQETQEFQEVDREITPTIQQPSEGSFSKRSSKREDDQPSPCLGEQQININLDEQNQKMKDQQEQKQCNDFDNKIKFLLQLKSIQEEQQHSMEMPTEEEPQEEQVYNIIQQQAQTGSIHVNWKKVKKGRNKLKQNFIVQQKDSPLKMDVPCDKSLISHCEYNSVAPNYTSLMTPGVNNYSSVPVRAEPQDKECLLF